MPEQKVFVILTELVPMEGCELSPSEVGGAAVRFYVPAEGAEQALALLRAWAVTNRFCVVAIDWCVDYDAVSWDNPDSTEASDAVNLARATGELTYGEFHIWPPGSDDA